jgi:chromosome segregation protein
MQNLGKINPLALEEFDALQKRHAYLQEQIRDIESARNDLKKIVKDVDAFVENAFLLAYKDISGEFGKVFELLFPQGKGRIRLENESDLLHSGIEIEASPAGKKLRRLTLLSGGEKSLAAFAFLVAIFKARPSPFYVLDEVEAALDDTNLSRMLEVLKSLASSAQLIIVTHQKRTMEVASMLYGITLKNDGITRVIGQKLD